MAKRTASSPDHDGRWRPATPGPPCGYRWDEKACRKEGAHYCEPRADRAVRFFPSVLVHTKGAWAHQEFELDWWQEHDIFRPVFGEAVWSDEWDRYVRRYRVAIIVLGRKNGKSATGSGCVLLLMVGDDEESAEVYGAAKDTKQAGKVFEPAWRMVELSPALRRRLKLNRHSRRIFDEHTASYYEIITSDPEGELGHNPHGFILDEAVSQPDGELWSAMRTASGARTQPLAILITTETSDSTSFAAKEIDEAERIQEDPARAPHVFVYVRKMPRNEAELERLERLFPDHPDLPVSLDPWDERNWRWPNPALGRFLSIEAVRQDALEARNDPSKENAFRQFRLNQRTQQVTRWMPIHEWDANVGEVAPNPEWVRPRLKGRIAWGGLDLSAKFDLTAWTLFVPPDDAQRGWMLWRFWAAEDVVEDLDKATAGQFSAWVRDGWVTASEGGVIDYEQVYAAIEADAEAFTIRSIDYDEWSGEPVRQEITRRTGIEMVPARNSYEHMSVAMRELKDGLVIPHLLAHGGNPVARWCADAIEARSPRDNPDLVKPVRPARDRDTKRIDGMVSAILSVRGWQRSLAVPESTKKPGKLVSF